MLTDKVVWKDGLFVQPQHFQQSEKYLLSIVQQSFAAYIPYYYGFTSYTVDEEALKNDMFCLVEAQGVMPDGTVFSIPQCDIAPNLQSLAESFGHEETHRDVYLALPLSQTGKASFTDTPDAVYSRFVQQSKLITDEVSGRSQEEIEVGKLNFSILLDNAPVGNFTRLKVARLKRDPDGKIILDHNYIPPILCIGASSEYVKILQSLVLSLKARGTELLQSRKEVSRDFTAFAPEEITTFGLLQIISTYTPRLNQFLLSSKKVHPAEVHTTLTYLAGSLRTFQPGDEIFVLPDFDYNALFETVTVYDKIIRTVLNADYSPRCTMLPVQKISEITYSCTVSDRALFDDAEFFLGVSADTPEDELRSVIKRVMKMSSVEYLNRLTISTQLGLSVVPVSNPPADLATKTGYIYFKLEKDGKHWDNIFSSGTIGFYFPNCFQDIKFEILALKHEKRG